MAPLAERYASPPDDTPASRRSLRIVVADDDKDTVLTLATVLRQEGHEVREVYRGDAVLDLIRDFEADAVLLDIGMPGMTGYDVARRLHERLGGDCPLLIAITAWNKGADKVLGQIAGFHHYLTKPYEMSELLDLLAPLASSGATPARPARPPSRKQLLLARAAQLMGQPRLAAGLKVSEEQLESWIVGRSAMPDRLLLDLANLLVEQAGKQEK